MILSYSDKMDGDLKASWIEVTEKVIQKETALYANVLPSMVTVDVAIMNQTLLASSRSRMLNSNRFMHAMSIVALRRNLQSSSPLQIDFNSHITFPSEEENWSTFRMVAGGFMTSREQARYILDLKLANPTDFSNLNSMTLEVEGEIVTESPIVDSAKDNTSYYIIAGVVGGALVLVLSLGTIYYRGQYKRNGRDDPTFDVQVVEVEKDRGEDVQTDNNTLNHHTYFGTIQQNDFDDVSTLGDPYMGDVVNPIKNTDPTLGER